MLVHHSPHSRSMRVVWLLEELGLPYELCLRTLEGGRIVADADYLALNPMGSVPTIEDGDLVLCESGAIVQYLLERESGHDLAVAPGEPERAGYLQWISFAEATAMPPIGDLAQHSILRKQENRIAAMVPDAVARLERVLACVEGVLASREYLVAGRFTGADLMLGYALHLARMIGQLGDGFPKTQAYHQRLADRPAYQKAAAV